jgi:predicted MFS family arabinose efflux permease
VALVAAHTSAQAGNTVTVLATPFFVLSLGGSALHVGVASAFATVPIIVGGPLGAVLVDRIGHRLSSIVADLASAVTVFAIAVLSSQGLLPFWGFLLLIFASGLLDTPGQTARTVLMPDVSEAAGVPLARTIGFSSGAERAAMLVGAPLGGLLVSLYGPSTAFAVTGLFFVVSCGLVLGVVRTPVPLHDSEAAGPASYWGDLAAGFRFVVRQPLLRLIVAMVFVTNLLDAARFSVLLPLRAEVWPGGATAVGLVTGALGAGALVGSLFFGFLGHRVRRRLFVIAFLVVGLPISLVLASSLPLWVVVGVSAVTGLASGVLNPIIGTLRLELAPPRMRARSQSLMVAGSWAGIPLGALLGGAGAEWIGVAASLAVVGVVYTAAALLPTTGGAWRRMDSA